MNSIEPRILDFVQCSIVIINKSGEVVYINRCAKNILDIERKEVLGQQFFKFFDLSKSVKGKSIDISLRRFWDVDKISEGEVYVICAKGSSREIIVRGSRIETGDEKQKYLAFIFRKFDIVEPCDKMGRDDEIQLVIDNLPAMIWIKDKESRFTRVNNKYEEAIGRKEEEIIGKTDFDFYSEGDAYKFRNKDFEVMDSGMKKNIFEVKPKGYSGGVKYLHTVKVPLKNSEGESLGTIGICEDVTDIKKTEERVNLLNDVIQGIRSVNKLIVQVRHRRELIQGTCDILSKIRGIHSVWIALVDGVNLVEDVVSSNVGDVILPFSEFLKSGGKPSCVRMASRKSEAVFMSRPHDTCEKCPLQSECLMRETACIRLMVNGKLYGFLNLTMDSEMASDSTIREMLREVSEDLSFALSHIELEEKSSALREMVDRLVFIDSEYFNECVGNLDGKSFKGTYLIADAVDSRGHNIDQKRFQRLLKGIVVKNGAVWGNSWGDMIHCCFSDYFLPTKDGSELSAYGSAIEMCREVKRKMGVVMRVGIASGRLTVSEDTIQLNQTRRSRIIEKAHWAQESRLGISTLQRPSRELVDAVKSLGYRFVKKEDIVRGELRKIWKLYPLESRSVVVKKGKKKEPLPYDSSVNVLLTKGVCGHGHFEGTSITSKLARIIRRAGDLYNQDPKLSKRFYDVTGVTPEEILKFLDRLESWGDSREKLDFKKHFLPWLYIMKMAEASSPQILYDLTRAQIEHELKIHAGFSREIVPLVWKEMGLSYSKNIGAFVQAVEDSLSKEQILGPTEIGVSVKRFLLTKNVSEKNNPWLSDVDYPYLKSLELVTALKQSKVSNKIGVYVDVVDIASENPLFGSKHDRKRGNHTKTFYREAKNLGASAHVHLLEEMVDKRFICKGQNRYRELDYVVEMLDELRIKNARFIHMAYWPKDLPMLAEIESAGHEMALCQTSTRVLGSMHKPVSPFLLKNPALIDGILYDNTFPRIVISTDDSGPLSIRSVWEEYIVVHNDITKWHGREFADICLIKFLRNAYNNMSPEDISERYGLSEKAVRWAHAYDLFTKASELKNALVRKAVAERGREILEERRKFLKR
ncbi:PAS domain S-box protein [Candidatus Dojkabacteria bacterium]|nr:PAS domain S-box protein [Candidatus Dojkabacteria bacterium]